MLLEDACTEEQKHDTGTARSHAWVSNIHGLRGLRIEARSHRFAPHTHPEYVVGAATHGAERCRWDRCSHSVEPGKLLIIEPNHAHEAQTVEGSWFSYCALLIDGALLTRYGLPSELRFGSGLVDDSQIFLKFLTLYQKLEKYPDGESAEDLLVELLGDISPNTSTPRFRPAAMRSFVSQAITYIELRHTEKITLSEIATHVGISPYHLTRVFRNETGLTPRQYQAQMRIARAVSALSSGQSIAALSYDLGFNDQAHFTSVFRSVVGITPGQYRSRRS